MNHSFDQKATRRSAARAVQTQLRRLSLMALTFVGLLLAATVVLTSITFAKPLTAVQLPLPTPTATPTPLDPPPLDTSVIYVDKSNIPYRLSPDEIFHMSGTAKGDAKVQIIKDDPTQSVIGEGYADADGKWGIDVKLSNPGTYKVQAKELVNDTTDEVTISVIDP